jgi:glutaredoxin-related protein
MSKIFSIIFFIFLFINKTYEKSNLKRQLESTAHNTGYNYGNHNSNYDSSAPCSSPKCKKSWRIFGICLFILIIIIFLLILICNIINWIKTTRISNNSSYSINDNNNNNNLLKKHYLFQNDLKLIIYNNDMIKYGEECTICLENFIVNKVRVCLTPCHHIFHFSCLKQYIFKSNDTHCPNCKFDFFSLLEGKNIDYDLVEIDESLPNNNIDDDNIKDVNKKKDEIMILKLNT